MFSGENRKAQSKLLEEFILPLVNEAAWSDNEDADSVGPHDQLADVKSGHDCLASARVVGEDKPQGLLRQHCLIYRSDLMGKRLYIRGMDGHHRIKKVRQMDPERLCCKLEILPGCVERPWPASFCKKKSRFVRSEKQSL